MNDQPDHPFNVAINSIADQEAPVDDQATALKSSIHDTIAQYPELTVYAIIGALRVVEYDLMDALTASNMDARDQTVI